MGPLLALQGTGLARLLVLVQALDLTLALVVAVHALALDIGPMHCLTDDLIGQRLLLDELVERPDCSGGDVLSLQDLRVDVAYPLGFLRGVNG